MKTDTKNLIVSLAALFCTAAVCSVSSGAGKRQAHHKPVVVSATAEWKSDPAEADTLGPETPLAGGYSIKAPAGYTLLQKKIPSPNLTTNAYEWRGEQRADGTYPKIFVSLVLPVGAFQITRTSDEYMDHVVSGFTSSEPGSAHSATEHGTISGIPFVRVYEKNQKDKPPLHAFFYVSTDSSAVITIAAQDVEPYNKTTLAPLEASALTFHR